MTEPAYVTMCVTLSSLWNWPFTTEGDSLEEFSSLQLFLFSQATPMEFTIWTIICSPHNLWSPFNYGSLFLCCRKPFVLCTLFRFCVCLCVDCTHVRVPSTSQSCCYFIHNVCPLVLFFFCWTLSCVACALSHMKTAAGVRVRLC